MPRVPVFKGGCLCGGVRYEARGIPFEITHCHCDTCRRAAGAVFVTWMTVWSRDFRFTKGKPRRFQSSARGIRTFCPSCGSQLLFENPKVPGEVDVTVASLDHPERVRPQSHTWASRRLKWLDETAKLACFPKDLPKRHA